MNNIFRLIAFSAPIFFFFQSSSAQDIEVVVRITPTGSVRLHGVFRKKEKSFQHWSFLSEYADAVNLSDRIKKLKFFSENKEIENKKLSPAEFQTDELPLKWQYTIDISPRKNITDAAHISWLSVETGILMTGDLFPSFVNETSALISFELPDGWIISTTETEVKPHTFRVANLEKAVFSVGKNLREISFPVKKQQLTFVTAGEWKMTDGEAAEQIRSIFEEYQNTSGELSQKKSNILLFPFPSAPENTSPDRWRVETRGSTVVIISGQLPHKSQAAQRLHEQLRHELFHLWIPNELALSGNYDWFYEGFTIYQALRTGVELNQIRFDDFLNTLAHAYQMSKFLSTDGGQSFSLIEASNRRWAGTNNFVYAKGLVVAFLCDVTILRQNKGKKDIREIFRRLLGKYRLDISNKRNGQNAKTDGNIAVLDILQSFPELNSISGKYITGKSEIEWKEDLTEVGIVAEGGKLKVMENPNKRQKDLLDKLGYNQWRKMLRKTK